eukprot:Phypoly_transcript_15279.p1 GENE.Phypoly_transcript_15279~~Phypoly_transcript_15279.p1  ORF type:complete len:272 (+),score=69.71 Phypoly_transcript_15279:60-875(+)
MVKKLPRGATQTYIDELLTLKFENDTLQSLLSHYPQLYLDNNLRKELLSALFGAIGQRKTHGWIWRTYSLPETAIEAVKVLYELLLTDHTLSQQLAYFSNTVLCSLHLDTHLENEDSAPATLELIRFIAMNPSFADYTQYVTSKEGRALVTKFLQDEQTSASVGSSSGSSTKRKREDEDDEETSTPQKVAKAGKVKWFWADDGPSGTAKWVEYDAQTTLKLEKAFLKNQKTAKVDIDRFVDFQNMFQKRYDDTTKKRNVKREVLNDDEEDD